MPCPYVLRIIGYNQFDENSVNLAEQKLAWIRVDSQIKIKMDKKKILQAAKIIAKGKHVVALTGAGISTPSGIPDFRSKDSGLWNRADPMQVASIWGFMEHPQGFFDWVKPLARKILDAQPNPAHRALAQLEARGKLYAVITQNIDNLHQRAGSKRVLEVHGHLRQATCIRCYHMMPADALIEKFLSDDLTPSCPECGSVMKPNVVLFGENLPVGIMNDAQEESRMCDVMLIVGSSLEVAPACDLPLIAKKNGAELIIVNGTGTPVDRHATVVLRDDVAMALPHIAQEI